MGNIRKRPDRSPAAGALPSRLVEHRYDLACHACNGPPSLIFGAVLLAATTGITSFVDTMF